MKWYNIKFSFWKSHTTVTVFPQTSFAIAPYIGPFFEATVFCWNVAVFLPVYLQFCDFIMDWHIDIVLKSSAFLTTRH